MGDQPTSVVTLKDHQRTLLYRCIQFEHTEVSVGDGEEMKTSIGVLGDKVGSGKSFVILSLIQGKLPFERNRPQYKSHANNHLLLIKKMPKEYIDTNVIVIPHNLCKQWEAYVTLFDPNLRLLVINKHKKIVPCDLSSYDLVILTCTMYNHFALQHHNTTFSRVFYDEADSINIPSCKPLISMFFWFVTASFDNLSHPYGHYVFNDRIGKYVEHAKGLKNNGFIKEMFASIYQNKNLSKLILVKNDDEFVKRSISLPAITDRLVECKTPYAISVLSNIVDKEVIRCLNANDVRRAIQCIHPSHRSTEDNIVSICVDKLTRNLKNVILRIDYVRLMDYDIEADRLEELGKLERQKDEHQYKIDAIAMRVKDNNKCIICYEDIEEKTVLNCCSNAFCFKCLSVWLSSNNKCPLCKSPASVQDVYVIEQVNEDPDVQKMQDAELMKQRLAKDAEKKELSCENDKMTNLLNILNMGTKKTLVFSQYDDGIKSIATQLTTNNISYSYLKGACASVNSTLERFRNGDVKVLLINPTHYGSGLNMECTTDIIMFHKFDTEMEKQVIGRAHRFGRQESLKVWYLLHDNEMPLGGNYMHSSLQPLATTVPASI